MKIRKRLPGLLAAAALLVGVSVPAWGQPQKDVAAITIGGKDIGGVVSSPQGREAIRHSGQLGRTAWLGASRPSLTQHSTAR